MRTKALTRTDREAYLSALTERLTREARTNLLSFTEATMPNFVPAEFHRRYYARLTDFALGHTARLMVFVPPQHGKLLPADTPVLTTKGWKSHGDLVEGDYVFGQDGKPKRVVGNSGVYEWNVERVSFSDDISILAAKEHLWKVKTDREKVRNGKKIGRVEEILETQHLFDGYQKRRPYIDVAPALEMPPVSLPIDPYLLGVWLGDGNSASGNITCGERDINEMRPLGDKAYPLKGRAAYRIHVDGLSKALRMVGLIGNKHIPMQYLLSSKEQRTALLQGLMDTDGTIDLRGCAEFTQKEGQLVDDVYVLLRTLGFKPTKHAYDMKLDGRIVGRKVRLCFKPDKGDAVFRLQRKAERLMGKTQTDRSDKKKLFIKSVTPHGVIPGNCIQVEGSMYLAGVDLIPTHNSEGSTRRLPAFVLGRNPDTRVAIVSYSATKARKFNREIQRIIDTDEYRRIFPETCLNSTNVTTVARAWVRNADECEIVGRAGGFKTVGVGGALTGEPVDLLIMDDIYKDAREAWSPRVRENISDWYDTVAETRLHNGSRQLIVFTRWHEDDLAGKLLREYGRYDPATNPDGWQVVIYPAIKTGAPTDDDPRAEGEALWPERHSLKKLQAIRARNPHVFDSLYQQDPKPNEGLMYDRGFTEYDVRPATERCIRKAYVDTADTGADFLCAIIYDETEIGNYIVDVLYTQRPMEYTEPALAEMLSRHAVVECVVESNNGGRGFARAVEQQCRRMGNDRTHFTWFHQAQNKAVRIFSYSAAVQNLSFMPVGWQRRFPQFAHAMLGYLKEGVNPHDDAPDALTGTVERRRRASSAAEVAALFGY